MNIKNMIYYDYWGCYSYQQIQTAQWWEGRWAKPVVKPNLDV